MQSKQNFLFSNWTNRDGEILQQAKVIILPHLTDLLDTFHDWLEQHDPGASYLRKENFAALQRIQRSYWQAFFSGIVDENYIESRKQFAKSHAEMELPTECYIESLVRLESGFIRLIDEASEPTSASMLRSVVEKLMRLDAAVVLDSFATVVEEGSIRLRRDHERTIGILRELSQGRSIESASVEENISPELAGALLPFLSNYHSVLEGVRTVARGDYRVAIAPVSEDDILGDALETMTETLRTIAEISYDVSEGDYSRTLPLKGEHDLLAPAVNQMVVSFRSVVEQVDRIAGGDYSAEIEPRSPRDSLGQSLQKMTKDLRESKSAAEHQKWIVDGINELHEVMLAQASLRELANAILSFFANKTSMGAAVLYHYNPETSLLQVVGSYASSNDIQGTISIGEGLVGQVGREKKKIVLDDVPCDALRIQSSFLDASPSQVVIFPILAGSRLVGVMECVSRRKFSSASYELLEKTFQGIAMALSSMYLAEQESKLLRESQELTLVLQKQEQELQLINVELEQQKSRLEDSQQTLEHQQQELEMTNAQLENQNETLALKNALVEQKNTELDQARQEIEEKAKDLASASKYKSEFLANMSHELRTPLNSMLLLSRHLSDNGKSHLDEEELEAARIVHASGNDLLGLINEILDSAKIEAGRISISRRACHIESITDRLVDKFAHVAREKGIEFDVSQGEVSSIYTDPDRLEQVLMNLISNAIKFTEKGSVLLEFRPAKVHEHGLPQELGDCIAICVKDTGIGIPMEMRHVIFEAFQQVEGSESRKYGGTGLGLSISRELTILLHGELLLTSSSPEGSTFTLFLPTTDTLGLDERPSTELAGAISQGRSVQARDESSRTTPELPVLTSIADDRDNIGEGDHVILIIEDDLNFGDIGEALVP